MGFTGYNSYCAMIGLRTSEGGKGLVLWSGSLVATARGRRDRWDNEITRAISPLRYQDTKAAARGRRNSSNSPYEFLQRATESYDPATSGGARQQNASFLAVAAAPRRLKTPISVRATLAVAQRISISGIAGEIDVTTQPPISKKTPASYPP